MRLRMKRKSVIFMDASTDQDPGLFIFKIAGAKIGQGTFSKNLCRSFLYWTWLRTIDLLSLETGPLPRKVRIWRLDLFIV